MLAYLFYAALVYLLFRFIVGFVVPLVRTTRQVKRSFREMNQRMQDQFGGAAPGAGAPKVDPAPGRPAAKDDYIDFEEIKD